MAGTSNLIGSGTNSLGALAGGVLLQLWGASHAIQVTGGVMTLLAVTSFLSPALKREASYETAD